MRMASQQLFERERKQERMRKRELQQQTAISSWLAARAKGQAQARPQSRHTEPPFQSTGKFYHPLLHKEQCTSIHSYLALRCLPHSIAERLIMLRDMNVSPFVANETKRMRNKRLRWEARLRASRSLPPIGPSFFEKRGMGTRRDYGIETKLRFSFRSLLVVWRQWRYASQRVVPGFVCNLALRSGGLRPTVDTTDLTDPVTLEPIQRPVFIFDHRAKRTFIFEATTLHRSIRSALTFQLYTISDPKVPKNLFTNTPYSCGQLMSIFTQLQAYGLMSLELMAWRKMAFVIGRYRLYMDPWLHIDAQRQEIYAFDSDDGQEIMIDFILDCLHDCQYAVGTYLEDMVRDAVCWFPEHEMMRRLRGLCIKGIEGEFFETPTRFAVLAVFRQIYKLRPSLWALVREKREAENRDAEQTDEEGIDLQLSGA